MSENLFGTISVDFAVINKLVVRYFSWSPLRRRRSALKYRAIEEEEETCSFRQGP